MSDTDDTFIESLAQVLADKVGDAINDAPCDGEQQYAILLRVIELLEERK